MSYLLIKFNDDYADEFDVDGFFTTTSEKWEASLEKDKKVFDEHPGEQESGFGTNESLIFKDYKDYLRCFTVTEITESEYRTLNKLFCRYGKGEAFFGIVGAVR